VTVRREVAVRGRISDDDIAAVRERVPLEQVVADHVALRNAGGGRLKGLCPFHDEKTPSFTVNTALGFYKCFGCGASGDVITFVRQIDHLDFADAIEMLARRAGIEIRREEGSAGRGQGGQRQRLLDAHVAASAFFTEQLRSPEAEIARSFLTERGFDEAAWAHFGVGYAPAGWDHLVRHLRGLGYSDAELLAGGIASQGQRGPIDRFRGRLIWPIRDRKGDVIGFGARRLRDDDNGPKYLNTPETPLYKKSQVLYGVDLAKHEIAKQMRAVVVEGYTDVMACHLAGERTAVATCGTAFGDEHVQVLRRMLMDQDELRGRVIFTFDGDEAGRNAALKAFEGEQKFVTQTFVAVQPDGLDPCELRQQRGDLAVRDLIASHIPLAEFVIRTTLDRHDLTIPEGRVQALAATAPIVAELKDTSLRGEYARRLAGWLGMDVEPVIERVRAAAGGASRSGGPAADGRATPEQPPRRRDPVQVRPDPRDPGLVVEREIAKLAVQRPALAGPVFDGLGEECFTSPTYAAVRSAVAKAGGAARAPGGRDWVTAVQEAAETDSVRELVTELAVEPMQSLDEEDTRYAQALLVRLEEMALTRRIEELKSKVQRLNPVDQAEEYNRRFGELIALEGQRKGLRGRAVGEL
jgi:DNA primase